MQALEQEGKLPDELTVLGKNFKRENQVEGGGECGTQAKKLTGEKQVYLSFNLGRMKKTKQIDIVPSGKEVIETW